MLLLLLSDFCYAHAVGPRGPLQCYKLTEMRMAGALALLSIASGAFAVARGEWFRRMAWCQVGFAIAAFLEAVGPIWSSAVKYGEYNRVPLVETFFTLAGVLSGLGTWLGRPPRRAVGHESA